MRDSEFMQLALLQAQEALAAGEIPVGAVVVKGGAVIAVGRNSTIGSNDPTAHAEIVALRAAAQGIGNYRLDGCELFVTLEPCAMCSGALLHARLDRLVFGAADPKTGAAGSALNLFANAHLNHRTVVLGGVLDQACSDILRHFFQDRRREKKTSAKKPPHPLRQDAVRTPDGAFEGLSDYPWSPHYQSDLPTLDGFRMHYLDEGPNDAKLTYLCLHGNPAWSYCFRKMIPTFLNAGFRVVVPDLIGFGKSDKPKKESIHSLSFHRQILLELVERLDLQRMVLVVEGWGGILGLTLPTSMPERFLGVFVMNTALGTAKAPLSPGLVSWREMCADNPGYDIARLFAHGNPNLNVAECAAYAAPFPDAGHRAATRAFPAMMPEDIESDGAAISREAQMFWRTCWHGQTMVAIGLHDLIVDVPALQHLSDLISGCSGPIRIAECSHITSEHGEPFARAALGFFKPH